MIGILTAWRPLGNLIGSFSQGTVGQVRETKTIKFALGWSDKPLYNGPWGNQAMTNRSLYRHIVCVLIMLIGMSGVVGAEEFTYLTVTDAEKLEKAYDVETGNSVDPISSGVNQNNLYQQIFNEFNHEYENIGKREAQRVLNNRLTVTGGLNSVGFMYRRPFADFGVSIERKLEPQFDHDTRWIVTDTFTVSIDASKIMGSLRDQQVIDMSQENLAAFAGIVFHRKFTWIHFAESYEDGLMRHFEKLFMPFMSLGLNHLKQMSPNEMIFKEDSLSFKAGGLVSAPLYTGVTGAAGVLAKFEKLTRLEIVSDPDQNILRLNFEKTKLATAGIALRVQADFLKILKMTLLSYDFSYELESSYKIFLNLKSRDLSEMSVQDPVAMELQQLLKNREGDLDILAPYIISEEKKKSQTLNHRYNFLLLGGQKTAKTQQIEITKEGKVKNFFKHYFEKMKYTEDALSRLFTSFLYKLMDVDLGATKLASETKKVALEYESERNLLDARDDVDIKGANTTEQKLSLTFTVDYRTQKTKGMLGKKYRERAKFILERMSGVNPLAINMIENDQLRAPYHVSGKYQINVAGIRYLNRQSVSNVFDTLDGVCDEQPKKGFLNFRNLFDNCRRSLQNDYIEYLKDLSHDRVTAKDIESCEKKSLKFIFSSSKKRAFLKSCLGDLTEKAPTEWTSIPLWPLKNFTNNLAQNCNSKVHYFNIFGLSNVFFYGSFDAVTEAGFAFTTSFHEGAFKGFGAVDHYMRVENLRAPSSVVDEN